MQLTEPTYLWALLGLLIPLAVHLLSRQAGKIVRVGSIRHLTETSTRRFSSLRFNEYWLFLLRALMVAVFVLLLSGLSTSGKRSAPRWVLVETPPHRIRDAQKSLDSLQRAGYELRYWAAGFPLVEEQPGFPEERPDYARLLYELKQTGAEAIIYATNQLTAFRGKQLSLPENIQWLQLPGRKRQTTLQASRLAGDSVMVLRGTTGPERTSFVHSLKMIPAGQSLAEEGNVGSTTLTIKTPQPLKVLLLSEHRTRRQARILEAALRALTGLSGKKVQLEKKAAVPDTVLDYDLIINTLGEEKIQDAPGMLIQLKPVISGPLLQADGPDTWILRKDLNRQSALRENLLVALGQLLFRDAELDQKIREWDLRTIDENTFFNGETAATKASGMNKEPLDQWMILALILLFIAERILAFYRRA